MDDARVYVPLQSQALVALDRESGAVAWKRDIESAWPPVLRDGVLYLAASDEVHALDPATGEQRWRTSLDRPVTAPLTWAAGWLVAVVEPGEIVAFNPSGGGIAWRTPLTGSSRSAVASEGSRLFVSLDDGRVVALAAPDGARLWEAKLAGTLNAPAATRDRVFVGSDNNRLYALDAGTGTLAWQWRVGGDVIGAATDSAGVVYFASLDNMLRAVNRGNGNQRWKKDIGNRPAIPPQVVNDVLLVTGVAPVVTAYDGRTGAAVGSYTGPAESNLQGAPMVDAQLRAYHVAMVVVTRDGRVTGLRPTAMLYKETAPTPMDVLPGTRLNREGDPKSQIPN